MNQIKDRITDVVAVIIWGVTIYLLYCGDIEWWPDSLVGWIVGGVMFYIEDDWVTTNLKNWLKQKFGLK